MSTGGKKAGKAKSDSLESNAHLASLASMEGCWIDWDESASRSTAAEDSGNRWPGALAVIFLTGLAWVLHRLPIPPFYFEGQELERPFGTSVLAIVLGLALANLTELPSLKSGCRWVTKWCIPAAVVLMGAGMDLAVVGGMGWRLASVLALVMVVALGAGWVLGRWVGISKKGSFLLGAGSAVCGSSAILALAPVIDADDEDVLVTVAVVNLVGLLAMFVSVGLLWIAPMNEVLFGAFTGATIHAVPQVVAAAASHSPAAAALATVVKLGRVAMLAPLILLSALWMSKNSLTGKSGDYTGVKSNWAKAIPWFVWGFLAFAILRSLELLPVLEFKSSSISPKRIEMTMALPQLAKWLLAGSMAAIGLQVRIRPMLSAGIRSLLAGLVIWVTMAVLAYVLLVEFLVR